MNALAGTSNKEKALVFKSFYIDVKIVQHRAATVCGLLVLCQGREGRNNSSDTFTPHYFLLCEGRHAEAGDWSKQHYLVSQTRVSTHTKQICREPSPTMSTNYYIFAFLHTHTHEK